MHHKSFSIHHRSYLIYPNESSFQPTIHGKCKTYYQVNAREEIATDITLNRDLSRCDRFVPLGDYTSPLALISGMVRHATNILCDDNMK